MKRLISILLLSLLLPALWMSSCDDESKETDYNPNVLTSKDYIRAEDAIMEIVNSFLKGINDSLVIDNGYGFIDACDVSFHPIGNYINYGYGPVNRMCQDGKFRKGIFRATFIGPQFPDWMNAEIQTDSLFVDNVLIEAHIQIESLGLNEISLPQYSLKVISSNIMLADSTKINGVSITANFLLTWSEGYLTEPIHEDDLYLISGSSSGFSADGTEFSSVIQDTLYNYVDCFWILQGIERITVPSADIPTGEIDHIKEDSCFNEVHFFFGDNLFYDMIK
jgi:hypothetical protein